MLVAIAELILFALNVNLITIDGPGQNVRFEQLRGLDIFPIFW
jgi:hypothetical protein